MQEYVILVDETFEGFSPGQEQGPELEAPAISTLAGAAQLQGEQVGPLLASYSNSKKQSMDKYCQCMLRCQVSNAAQLDLGCSSTPMRTHAYVSSAVAALYKITPGWVKHAAQHQRHTARQQFLVVASHECCVQPAETLHHFAGQNDMHRVRTLLDSGADVNARDSDGATPLHFAADRGAIEVARCLLEAGADVHAKDSTGMTALHYAALSGKVEVRVDPSCHSQHCAQTEKQMKMLRVHTYAARLCSARRHVRSMHACASCCRLCEQPLLQLL